MPLAYVKHKKDGKEYEVWSAMEVAGTVSLLLVDKDKNSIWANKEDIEILLIPSKKTQN